MESNSILGTSHNIEQNMGSKLVDSKMSYSPNVGTSKFKSEVMIKNLKKQSSAATRFPSNLIYFSCNHHIMLN